MPRSLATVEGVNAWSAPLGPCLSPAPARFSHFFLLNDFSTLSRSLEQARMKCANLFRVSWSWKLHVCSPWLTSVTWLYDGFRCTTVWGYTAFLKCFVDQLLVFNWSQDQINFFQEKFILLVFSVTPFKIDQNINKNRSIDKIRNLGNERR